MDNKMLCCNISVPMCLLESYPCQGICYSPLDTQEDLALLDNSLRQDKELQQRFLRFLAIKCGRDLKTTVWRMLQSIFSNHLSINTTWTGVGDKACFRDMFLKTIVQRAIRKNPATQDATDEAIQVNVTRYLKGASEHEGGKRRRTQCYRILNLTMDIAVQLLNLCQGNRPLENYVMDFCSLASQVDINEVALKEMFCFGLIESISSLMPGGRSPLNLAQYIDLALQISGSTFTVGETDIKPMVSRHGHQA
ncbi:uncharacterized protein LOC127645724 [Xyrauchen texanus]|uniref:uncharacterized protein LOC127645724 n=1 Tax=Xyrauchen texanus TaxID=154827 RepID=UPI00224227AA|nr:uncharacterized protein LOC127645724 [Xyrauchen texanus]